MTALGIPQIREFFRAESVMVHEERFPPPRLSAGCAFRKETIAGMRRDGRDAPQAVVPLPGLSAALVKLPQTEPRLRLRYFCLA